jgi:glyceraldehyde 3-phosphate dehydrogenase
VVDPFVKLGQRICNADVDTVVRDALESDESKGIQQFCDRPIVSSDIVGNSHCAIYNTGFGAAVGS